MFVFYTAFHIWQLVLRDYPGLETTKVRFKRGLKVILFGWKLDLKLGAAAGLILGGATHPLCPKWHLFSHLHLEQNKKPHWQRKVMSLPGNTARQAVQSERSVSRESVRGWTQLTSVWPRSQVYLKKHQSSSILILHLFIRNTFLMIVHLISIWKEIWGFTFQNDAELRSRRRSHYVRRVLHVAEESTVVAELSRTQLYRDVPLVYVSDKLNSFFELMWSRESLPIGKVENLQREGKSGLSENTGNANWS